MSHNNQTDSSSELLDAHAVGVMLGCSADHVRRLSHRGEIPPPVELGRLRRWSRRELRDWIARGGPPVDEQSFQRVDRRNPSHPE